MQEATKLIRKKRLELARKIEQINRRRKMAMIGLVLGVALITVGQLLYFPALFVVGYTVFIICTGVASFLTAFKWLYARGSKAEIKGVEPPVDSCPRCGAEVREGTIYCKRCGKKIRLKTR